MKADMRLPNPIRPESPQAKLYQVFPGPEDDLAEESRHIGFLVDAWLKSQDECGTDARAASRSERRLHDAIKAGPLYGKVLSFAGLNLWVDDRTSEGLVESQESISL
jgi:hypothetical protein